MLIANSREPHALPVDGVKPYERHARRHAKAKPEKHEKLVASYVQVAPTIIDGANASVSGIALHTPTCEIGTGETVAISIVARNKSKAQPLRVALNCFPLKAAGNNESLRSELQELVNLGVDLKLTEDNQSTPHG